MEVELRAGAKLNLLSPQEFNDGLTRHLDAWDAQQVARLRGIKPIRMAVTTGKASGSALTMGGDSGEQLVTPGSGYVWSIRHLVIEGLTSGASPDVVNIVRSGRIIWQLNGNQFAQTWGRGEILLFAGETLQYQSVGTFNSTATIVVHGLAQEAPAELAGKLYA